MRYLIMALSLSILGASCSKKELPSDTGRGNIDSLASTSYLDVSYGNDPRQKLDVYLPKGRNESTRTIVVIHGGGWTAGDKSDFNAYIAEIQRKLPGYAFANLNYRLVTETSNYFPAQENDIRAAMRYLKSNSATYNVSQEYFILGISAGAHLGLLHAYKHPEDASVKGVISFFGPVDLQQLYVSSGANIPWVAKTIARATAEGKPNIFVESSPINYVTAASPPTLMLHGDRDNLVPLEQAKMLETKLKAAGVTNKLVVYPGLGHGWGGAELEDSFNHIATFISGLTN